MSTTPDWGADGEISMPEPDYFTPARFRDMGGFRMTPMGLTHGITEAQCEEILRSGWHPDMAR